MNPQSTSKVEIIKNNLKFSTDQRTNGPVNAHLRSAAYTNKQVLIVWYLTPVQGQMKPLGQFEIEISPLVSEKIFEGFYHIWAWRPSWSCDLDFINIYIGTPIL